MKSACFYAAGAGWLECSCCFEFNKQTISNRLRPPATANQRQQTPPPSPPPILDAGVKFVTGKAAGVTHAAGRSTLALEGGKQIAGSLVLDATGHSRRLVEFDQKFDPGYQGAYGVIAEVESHPFDIDTMLFM